MKILAQDVLLSKNEIPEDLLKFFEPAECGECYVCKLVAGFREVRRVLRDDGVCWINLGDSYLGDTPPRKSSSQAFSDRWNPADSAGNGGTRRSAARSGSLKPKDLVGIPWRVAFALQADGWWLRSEIIWAKKNCMPESVTDRPTKSHEQIFLLSKKQSYFYDAEAVKVPASETYANDSRWETGGTETNYKNGYAEAMAQNPKMPHRVFNGERRGTVNLRDVWHISSQAYPESHFATFPEDLIKPCILAGTSARGCCPKCGAPWERVVEKVSGYEGARRNDDLEKAGTTRGTGWKSSQQLAGLPPVKTLGWQPTCECGETQTVPCIVIDPFAGSGTTGQVALELGRKAILIELNPKYAELIKQRTHVTPGFAGL